MTYSKINLLAALLLLVVSVRANPPGELTEYEKTFSQTFDVNGSGTVNLTNRYGRIDVETWDRNEVKIDVRIVVVADNQDKADQVFDRIEISFGESGNTATAITRIGSGKSSRNKGWLTKLMDGDFFSYNSSSSSDYKINYRVRMPATADLVTDARYCEVNLPDLSGEVRATVAYGNMAAGKIKGRCDLSVSYGNIRVDEVGESSELRVRYSDNNKIRKAGDFRYDGRYSETEFEEVGRLVVNAGYDDVEVRKATEVRIDGNYNDIVVENTEILYYDGSYSDLEIGTVHKDVEISSSYGDVEIDRLGENFKRVYIRTSYSDVEIGMTSIKGTDMELRTRYGDISLPRFTSITRPVSGKGPDLKIQKSGSSESVVGRVPGGSGSRRMDISTSYGDIVLELQ